MPAFETVMARIRVPRTDAGRPRTRPTAVLADRASSRTTRRKGGFVAQPKRWRVEQTYGILVLHRRLVRDYEYHPASSASRVYRAMIQVMTRRLTGENTPPGVNRKR